jgi:hypothetical protein
MSIAALTFLSLVIYVMMYCVPGPLSLIGASFQGPLTLAIALRLKRKLVTPGSILSNCILVFTWAVIFFVSILYLGATPTERNFFLAAEFRIIFISTIGGILSVVIGIVIAKEEQKKAMLSATAPQTIG